MWEHDTILTFNIGFGIEHHQYHDGQNKSCFALQIHDTVKVLQNIELKKVMLSKNILNQVQASKNWKIKLAIVLSIFQPKIGSTPLNESSTGKDKQYVNLTLSLCYFPWMLASIMEQVNYIKPQVRWSITTYSKIIKEKHLYIYPTTEKFHEKLTKTLSNPAEIPLRFYADTGRKKGREILPRPQSL